MDIKIPSVGESIKEARILRWIKQDGDFVKADEPVLEIETDKASDNVASPGEGIVRIKVQADQVVAVGTVVGTIEPGKAPAVPRREAAVPTARRRLPLKRRARKWCQPSHPHFHRLRNALRRNGRSIRQRLAARVAMDALSKKMSKSRLPSLLSRRRLPLK